MSRRPRFRDAALDERYEQVGYVVIPGAARSAVRPLRRVHRRLMGRVPAGFHSTPYSSDAELKRAVDSEIRRLLLPVVDRLLTGHRPLLASFISKDGGGAGAMPPHQDWTFVDEPESSSMNFWVPLVDVDARNGAMSLLPGGHLVPHNIRGTGTDNSFREIEPVAASRMVEVPMRAGDVVVHDHRVLHSSPPNRRRRPRIVAGCALVEAHTPAIHYWQSAPGTLQRYRLEDRFFTDHTFGADQPPPSAHPDRTIEHENPVFGEQDLPTPPARPATSPTGAAGGS